MGNRPSQHESQSKPRWMILKDGERQSEHLAHLSTLFYFIEQHFRFPYTLYLHDSVTVDNTNNCRNAEGGTSGLVT